MIFTAGLREVGFDRDSPNYEYFFYNTDDQLVKISVEFTFLWLSKILYNFSSDVHIIFMFYAFVGISLKMFALKKLSHLWFLPMIIYLGNYFLLQELTQIRASVVTSILLLTIIPLAEGKKLVVFLMIAACCTIHYSSFSLFPILFLNNKDMDTKQRILWASLVPIGYVCCFAGINILAEIPIPYISEKIEMYQELRDKGIKGDEINVFNIVILVKVISYLYLIYFYDTIRAFNPYSSLIIKYMGASLFSYLIFSPLPVLAVRISELYGVVDIMAYSFIFYTIRPVWLGRIVVCIIGLALYSINMFYSELFNV